VRKLIVSEFVTVDGVIEAPGGEPSHPHTGWVGDLMGPNAQEYKSGEVFEAESLLLGRVTYESFAGAWPTYEGPMADRMNSMPKHVVSTTLTDPEWNGATVIGGDVIAEITKLKQSDGGPIMVNGSATLVHSLIENDLVDLYRLMVFPLSIGGGLRLFPDSRKKTALRGVDTVTYENGVVLNVYEPAH
jgi:dihydrofolate reductase